VQARKRLRVFKWRDVTTSLSIREQQQWLASKISELPLTLTEPPLNTWIHHLYQELEAAGITFKPKTYLSDDWGCPNKVPIIGIPFYLGNPHLITLISQRTGIDVREEVILMFLRHEAGHAFNYAYYLYRTPEWRQLFGPFSKPYPAQYHPIPGSPNFVHHFPGWYAQRHPDDDFAETFAVWLTPNSDWQHQYATTPAFPKLVYVKRIVRQYHKQPPSLTDGTLDRPVHEITMTVKEWLTKRRTMIQL
jgi:hypothetical protein